MEPITITLAGFGATHSFTLPATTAAAWMASAGIPLDNPAQALKDASLLIVKPIVKTGLAVQSAESEEAILSAVEVGV